MKKREFIEKYLPQIQRLRTEGKSLKEIARLLQDEYDLTVSIQYLSRLLKSKSKKQRTKALTLFQDGKPFATIHKISNGFFIDSDDLKKGFYTKLPPVIENLLPEGINKEFVCNKYGIDKDDTFALLSFIVDGFGGVSVQESIGSYIAPFDPIVRYEESLKRYEDIVIEQDVVGYIQELYFQNRLPALAKPPSISGAQPKFELSYSSNRLYIPDLKQERSNAFMKIVNKSYRNINLQENLFLHFARLELGFVVATTFVLLEDKILNAPSFAKELSDHLIAKRIDRSMRGTIECVELIALMQRSSQEKYDIALEDIFRFLDERIELKELAKLAEYIFYSYLVGNGDMHAKNIAFFKKDQKLAPLYDVVNTKIYKIDDDLGMMFKKRRKIKRKELKKFLGNYSDRLDFIEVRFYKKIKEYINATPFDKEVAKALKKSLGLET